MGRYSAAVLYRNGGEEVHPDEPKHISTPPGLQTSGEFGLLGVVLEDAVQSKLDWNHWEQGASGPGSRCTDTPSRQRNRTMRLDLPGLGTPKETASSFNSSLPIRGEIAIDPSSGTILRLVLSAVAQPSRPSCRGRPSGRPRTDCPGRQEHTSARCAVLALSLGIGKLPFTQRGQPAPRLQQTSLNDVAFEQYPTCSMQMRAHRNWIQPIAPGAATISVESTGPASLGHCPESSRDGRTSNGKQQLGE